MLFDLIATCVHLWKQCFGKTIHKCYSTVIGKLLRMSRNGPYRFVRILGKILSTLDTDDMDNGLQNGKIDTIR